ncbi:hypothetical protein [Bordetella muralis]|uniref:hypothetical protein n=1 Tax=Bordetella muralis TaxID=1649130 RepID=UPI0039EDF9B0
MSQAFINHGTPDITSNDFDVVQTYAGDAQTNVPDVAHRTPLSSSPPFYADKDGNYYSYHFWLYSLLVAPFLFIVKLLGRATPWAFIVANVISAIAASWAICMWKKIGREQRLLLLTLFWSCGTIPYIRWTHPEVFCASLLVVSLIWACNHKYVLSAIFAAIAAQQNPPILLWVAALMAIDLCSQYQRTKSIWPSTRKLAEWGVCLVLASLSMAFFFIHFDTSNLITRSGGAKTELISIDRLWSFYFDLNQGVVLLLWPLLALVPVVMTYGIAASKLDKNSLIVVGGLALMSLMLAFPSISTPNFNPGTSFILRYAYWASIPLIFIVTTIDLKHGKAKAITWAGILSYVVLNLSYYTGNWPSYLHYTPTARYVMEKFPGMYNPIPEIFIERATHSEGRNDKDIYFYAANGKVRKILLNASHRNIGEFQCLNGKPAREYVTSKVSAEAGWTYFNLRDGCTSLVNENAVYKPVSPIAKHGTLFFNESGTGKSYLGAGWSHPETWGVWSAANEAEIALRLADTNVQTLSISANAFVNGIHKEQLIDFFVNDIPAGSIVLTRYDGNRFSIHIPDEALPDIKHSNTLRLNLKFRTPARPKDLGISEDDRMLALGLVALTIN